MDLTRSARIRVKQVAARVFPKAELLLTGFYLLAATLWIVYLDQYLASVLETEAEFPLLMAAKGINFVLTTGAVLYLVLRRAYTGKRTAEHISRKSAERFELVARAASEAMWDWDLRSNRFWRSEGYGTLFGYGPKDLTPGFEFWMERLHPEEQDRVVTGLRQAIRSGQERWADEYRFRTKQGAYVYVSDCAFILRDEKGEPERVIGGMTDITQRRKAELEVRRSRERLRALSSRLQSLREDERMRISREIHDELGQLLTGIKMALRWVEDRLSDPEWPPTVNPVLDRVVESTDLVDRIMISVRRIASELRPDLLDSLGLFNALRFEADRFAKLTGVEIRYDLPELAPQLPVDLRTGVFRIFQETLTNVARHAEATRLEIKVRLSDGRGRLTVRDDGRGIAPDAIACTDSLGLLGMQERAALLKGDLFFDSPPNGGTVVTLEFPLPAEDPGSPA